LFYLLASANSTVVDHYPHHSDTKGYSLAVDIKCQHAECHYTDCQYTECRYTECQVFKWYAECLYDEFHYAEYCGASDHYSKLLR